MHNTEKYYHSWNRVETSCKSHEINVYLNYLRLKISLVDWYSSAKTIVMQLSKGSGTSGYNLASVSYNSSGWYHITWVNTGTKFLLYVNGVYAKQLLASTYTFYLTAPVYALVFQIIF